MKKEIKEIEGTYPLRKHDAKSFGVAFVLGVIIGLAIIVPGVSGAAVAIMFGMYAALLYAIGNILNDFRRCLAWLIPIGLGAIVGFLGGFVVIQKLFGRFMFVIVCLFAGLMCGAVPAITGEIKGEKRTPWRILLLVLGALVPLAVGGVSILLSEGTVSVGSDTFTSFPIYSFLLYLPLGMIVATTQIVPGLSATAILMACGQFKPLLNSLHLDYILENPAVLGLYACIGTGFLGGMVLISRLFSKLIEKRRAPTFFFVVGLSLGSIASMFFNTDMWEIYTGWASDGLQPLSIVIGAALLALGFVGSFTLTRYELKKRS